MGKTETLVKKSSKIVVASDERSVVSQNPDLGPHRRVGTHKQNVSWSICIHVASRIFEYIWKILAFREEFVTYSCINLVKMKGKMLEFSQSV